MSDENQYITPEGLEKAKTELEGLRRNRREISERIEAAKELGDLSENAEYHQAKDDLAFNEGRIAELDDLVLNAVVAINGDTASTKVQVGSRVRVVSDRGEQEYIIVGVSEANPLQGKISLSSPLGEALFGRSVNDRVEVKTPRGQQQFTIVSVG